MKRQTKNEYVNLVLRKKRIFKQLKKQVIASLLLSNSVKEFAIYMAAYSENEITCNNNPESFIEYRKSGTPAKNILPFYSKEEIKRMNYCTCNGSQMMNLINLTPPVMYHKT